MRLFILTVISAIFATSCGLRPVYGNATDGSGPISVSQIDGRTGHRVRQELALSLSSGLPGVAPGARLETSLDEKLTRLPLKRDDGVSRSSYDVEAKYRLYSADGELLAKGTTYAAANFDSTTSSYGDIALQTDARERVGRTVARRIREQLILDLSQTAEQTD